MDHIRQNGGSARDPNDAKTTVELSANTISKMEVLKYDVRITITMLLLSSLIDIDITGHPLRRH